MTDIVLRIQSAVGGAIAEVSKFRQSIADTRIATTDLRDTWRATTTELIEDARKQVAAEQEKVKVYREQLGAVKELTATYKRGSDERRIATQMEIELQHKLQATLGETAVAAGRAGRAGGAGNAERDASGLARGAASRSGVVGAGMSALAGPGFLVGAVVGGAIDVGVKAAKDEEVAQANLANAVRDSGNARKISTAQLEEYVKAEEHATGFTRDEVTQTLSLLIRSTGSLTKARQDEAVMANVARARQTDLSGAYMLVLRASEGNVGSLKRLGIEVSKTTTYEDQLKAAHLTGNIALEHRAKALDLAATKSDVMAAVTKKFAGDSSAYMKTFGGRTAELTNTWRDLEVEIGQKAIPELTILFGWINKEIDAVEHSKRAHDDFKAGLAIVETVIKDVDKVTGGFVDTLKLLAAWWATGKVIEYATTVKKSITGAYDGAAAAVNRFRRTNAEADAAVVADSEAAGVAVDAAFPWAAIIQAAVIATIEIVQHWSTVKKWFLEFWGYLKETGKAAWAALEDLAKGAVYVILNEATAAIQGILEVASHLPFVGKKARAALDDIQGYIAKWKPDFGNVVAAFGQGGSDAGNAFAMNAQQTMAAAASGTTGTGGSGAAAASSPGRAGYTGATENIVSGGGAVQKGIVATAQSALGNPYQYGGNPSLSSPTDCSGLMVAVFSQHGINLPRTSEEQFANAPIKNARPLAPGDLVFAEGVHPGHVGLYIGGGQVLEDPHTGDHVKIVPLSGFGWNGESARWWAKDAKPVKGGPTPAPPSTSVPNNAFDNAVSQASAAAAAAKAAKAGLKAPTLIGLEGSIAAELNAARKQAGPDGFDAIEKEAVAQIEKIKAALHPGMSQTDLAKDRVELAKWGKNLKDELKKNADEAKAAARQHAKEVKAAAQEAAKAWADGWQADVAHIDRSISEQWALVQQTFDRETQANVAQMQRDFQKTMTQFDRDTQAHLTKMQRDFQTQMTAFDRETQRGLDALNVTQTPAEKALADFQAQIATQQHAATVAQQQSDLAAAIATGDPAQIKQAQDAINQQLQTDQLAALQTAADASRKAADAKTAQDQQSYQDQRDALKQSLQDAEDLLEQHYQDDRDTTKQGLQDTEAIAEQSYQDRRAAQWQALQDLHDDQVTAFDADLKVWEVWLSKKQKSWSDFLAWLQANPVSKGLNGGAITDPSNTSAGAGGGGSTIAEKQLALAAAESAAGDEGIAAFLRQAAATSSTSYSDQLSAMKLAMHASGGIHMRPSIGVLGDQGPEATFPLTGQRGQQTIQMLADAIVRASGGGGRGTVVYGTFLGATEKQVGRALEGLVTPQQARVVRYKAPF